MLGWVLLYDLILFVQRAVSFPAVITGGMNWLILCVSNALVSSRSSLTDRCY